MQYANFTGCCAAKVIYGFGGGHNWQSQEYCSSRETILRWVIDYINTCRWNDPNVAVIFAAPTSTQETAIKALQDLGFYHNDDGSNNELNKTHKIYPMYYCMNEYDSKLIKQLEKEIEAAPKKKVNPFN